MVDLRAIDFSTLRLTPDWSPASQTHPKASAVRAGHAVVVIDVGSECSC